MNFPGPINSNLSTASAVSLDADHFSFVPQEQTATGQVGANGIVVPDKHLLFTGDYTRAGNDLVLSAPDQKYVVHDYFKGEKRPALISEDGAMLSGHIVSALTGHVQYAQATAPDAAAQIVGHVMKLTGSASVIRNGVTVELNIGDAVQKGDVIQTGSDSTIAMTLIDGSAFGMTSNARMVLNEMVYDPNGSSNSSFISLVQGTVTFVAGQTAKNGNMRVETPVATMGIRGTAVLTKIDLVLGTVEVSLGVEPDQHVGGLVFYDNATGALVGTMTQAGRVTIFSPSGVGQPVTATEYQKSPDQVLSDKSLFNQVFQLYFPNFNPDDSKPKSTDRPRTDIGVPPTVLGKNGTDPDTGRPTITYVISSTNPDTHVTTDLRIVYVNTPPSFSVSDVIDVQAATLGAHQFKLGDQVTISDPDIGAAPFFDVAIPYVPNSGLLAQATGTSPAPNWYLLNANLVSLDPATGVVTYNPEGFRFLGDGETAVYKFTFVAASGIGGSGSDQGLETLYLTVTGENDAPVFSVSDTPLALGEDDALQSTLVLNFTDYDFSDIASSFQLQKNLATTVTGSNIAALTAKLPSASILASYLTIDNMIDPATGVTRTNLSSDGQVTAKFAAPDHTFDFLGEGESVTLTYTVGISDGHLVEVTPGNFQQVYAEETVTVTITGANDAPALSVDVGPHALTETTDAVLVGMVSTLAVAGTLDFTDVDIDDAHATTSPTTVANAVWQKPDTSSGGTIPTATLNALATALTTTLTTDSTGDATGHIAWDFKLPDGLADFLATGETLTIVYDVNVNDGNTGGNVTQPVTIVITGTNDAPSLTAGATLPSVAEDSGGPGQTLSSLFAGNVQDVDQNSYLKGFAISDSGVSSDGTWWFSDNGGVWSPIGSVSQGAALIVDASVLVKFTPNTDFNGDPPQLTVYAIDDSYAGSFSSGSGGPRYTVDLTQAYTHGGTSPISQDGELISTTITPVNDAPVATGTATIAAIDEDTIGPVGDTVSNLFAANFSDAKDTVAGGSSADSFAGIAITSYTPDSAKGDWEYSIDNGSSWVILGTTTFAATVLLGSSDMLRFVPAHDYNGAATALSANLIESGEVFSSGNTINLSVVGGTTHFSLDQITLGETINPVNDAPDFSGSAFGQAFVENGNPVQLVGTGGLVVHDVDNSNFAGGSLTASVGTTGSHIGDLLFVAGTDHIQIVGGDIQFDADGTAGGAHFVSIGTLTNHGTNLSVALNSAADAAAVMELTQAIRFSSTSDDPTSDQRTVTFTLNDGGGTANGGHDTTSFDVAVGVTPVNDAPVLTAEAFSIQQPGPSAPNYGLITKVVDIALSDADEGSAISTVTATAGHGTVTYFNGTTDVSLSNVSGTDSDINAIFQNGITYTPTSAPSVDNTDKLTVTVTDSHGASDTINFIFQQAGAPDTTQLTGTVGKDLLFATEHADSLTGLAGSDNFIFASTTGQHTVADFTQGQDRIDLRMTGAPTTNAELTSWLSANAEQSVAHPADTILYLDTGHSAQNEIVLQNVTLANLTANDFILHPVTFGM